MDKPKRTLTQNAAIHKYFAMLSESLNNAGLDVKKTLRQDFDISWTSELVKELIWKEVQRAMFNVDSTTKLDTKQISEIYEVINRHMAQTFGVSVVFPSREK